MDSAKFESIYRSCAPQVHRRALQLLRDGDEALDVTQEVFERVLLGRHGDADPEGLVLWTYRVTTNLCLNRLRDRRRRAALLRTHSESVPVGRAETGQARVEAGRTLAVMAEGAPKRELEAFVYCHVDGMTQEEAAQVLGVTSRTVRNLLVRFARRAKAAGSR